MRLARWQLHLERVASIGVARRETEAFAVQVVAGGDIPFKHQLLIADAGTQGVSLFDPQEARAAAELGAGCRAKLRQLIGCAQRGAEQQAG